MVSIVLGLVVNSQCDMAGSTLMVTLLVIVERVDAYKAR